MKIRFFYIFFIFYFSFFEAQIYIQQKVNLMGSRFEIGILEKDSSTAREKIHLAIEEIKRIEKKISEWDSTSCVSKINQNAGIAPVEVDKELFSLTQKALYFSKISSGAFDISIASMDKIWRFDGSLDKIPSHQKIKKSIEKVGYQNIVLDSVRSTIFLKKKGMKIGFGATGKSYSADKARELMQSLGVKAGMINASGDIAFWGEISDLKPWKIGIYNPIKGGVMEIIQARGALSVATSGDYRKFIEFKGKRYGHIINPKTGYPSYGVASVTIVGKNTEIANGFSTSIMVLGEKKGKKLMKLFPNYEYFIVLSSGKILKSKKWRKEWIF